MNGRLEVAAALLAQGGTLHGVAAVFALGTWLVGGFWLSVSAAGLFAVGSVLAVRVGLDASLFAALARGLPESELDRGLVALGLVREARPRTTASRLAGGMRLWRMQVACTVLQGALFVGAVVGS